MTIFNLLPYSAHISHLPSHINLVQYIYPGRHKWFFCCIFHTRIIYGFIPSQSAFPILSFSSLDFVFYYCLKSVVLASLLPDIHISRGLYNELHQANEISTNTTLYLVLFYFKRFFPSRIRIFNVFIFGSFRNVCDCFGSFPLCFIRFG